MNSKAACYFMMIIIIGIYNLIWYLQRLYQLLSGYINYSAVISITQRLYQLLSGYINYSEVISITQRLYQLLIYMNHFGGVMVIVLASSAVDREFEPRSGQTKHYQIGIFCFSTKHAALSRNSKDWLAQNRDNMSEWGVMYIRELLFQWVSTIKIQLSVLL
jgi:hypothetical protein